MKHKSLPVVAVIILNWNGREHVLRCLEHIDALEYPKKCIQLLVVDNGSTDGSQKAIAIFLKHCSNRYLQAKLVDLPQNIGAPAGFNHALDALHKRVRFVWKLDNDVSFEPDYLKMLIEKYNCDTRGNLGGVSGMIVGGPESYEQAACVVLHGTPRRYLSIVKYLTASEYLSEGVKAKEILGLIGPSCLFTRDGFEKVGRLDERFFLYYDETEFCTRLFQGNFRFALEPKARIIHFGEASNKNKSPRGIYFLLRNHYLLGIKYYSGRERLLFFFLYPLWAVVRFMNLVRSREYGFLQPLKIALKAVADALGGRFGPPPASLLADRKQIEGTSG